MYFIQKIVMEGMFWVKCSDYVAKIVQKMLKVVSPHCDYFSWSSYAVVEKKLNHNLTYKERF